MDVKEEDDLLQNSIRIDRKEKVISLVGGKDT